MTALDLIWLIRVETAIFIVLGFLHVYWALRGGKGSEAVIPAIPGKGQAFYPVPFMTLVVAGGLLLFAFITYGNTGKLNAYIPVRWFRIGLGLIAILFAIRAMGDFRYVGFTKKVRGTRFSVMDNRYYSPLCLLLSIASVAILIFHDPVNPAS